MEGTAADPTIPLGGSTQPAAH
ncbi:hypothetical protein LINPERHAP1_LOCUS34800 [Linum perenne]